MNNCYFELHSISETNKRRIIRTKFNDQISN